MTMDVNRFGFGITGNTDARIVRELAPMLEQAGFNTLWFNHTVQGNAFAAIEVAASVTSHIRLATGVTSIDSLMSATKIVKQVNSRDLPLERLTIGIGAAKPPSPLATIREGIAVLNDALPDVPVYVGALGPRMRKLGVTEADGVLLNWLTPAAAELAMQDRRRVAPESSAKVALYIRCSLGSTGAAAMHKEANRYQSFPSYAANFARLGITAIEASVMSETPSQMQAGLEAYQDVVDEPVLRAIVGEETLAAYASLVESIKN